MFRREDLVVLFNLSWLNFQTYVIGSTPISKSRLQGCNHTWSADLAFPFPYGNRSRTGTWYWDSYWRNNFCARIILCTHSRNIFTTNVSPPSPLIRSSCAHCHWLRTGDRLQGPDHLRHRHCGIQKERYRSKIQRFWRIYQGSDRNRTEVGRIKVTDIDYNTVEPYYYFSKIIMPNTQYNNF